MSDRTYFLLAVIIYGISMLHSVFLWRKGFRHHDRITTGLLLAGFVLQTRAMIMRGLTFQQCPINNLYEPMVFVTWTIVLVSLIAGVLPRFRFLGAFAAPVIFAVGVFALMPALDIPVKGKPQFSEWALSLHASLALLSYGAFGLGAIASWMFLTQQRDLKLHRTRAVFSLLPPMERLDKVMTRLLLVGLGLLTLSLSLVPLLVKQQTVKSNIANDPKVIWSMVVWASYFWIYLRHRRFGLTGRRFAWGAIAVFAFVLLTFGAINFLSPAHQL